MTLIIKQAFFFSIPVSRAHRTKKAGSVFVSIEKLGPEDHALRNIGGFIGLLHGKAKGLFLNDGRHPALNSGVLVKRFFPRPLSGIVSQRRLGCEIHSSVTDS